MSNNTKPPILFSDQLEAWLKSDAPKTLGDLASVFAEKSFAVTFILLMGIPALPLPTGGITHIFEIITALMCVQLALGFQKFWLPKKLQKTRLNILTRPKTIQKIIRLIHWFERHSRPRMADIIKTKPFISVAAIVMLLFTISSFVAPPFSGLDTLPAMGVVVISLGLILEDMLVIGFGTLTGIIGIGLIIFLSDVIILSFQHIFWH